MNDRGERDLSGLAVRDAAGGAVVSVKAVPGSSRDRIAGVLGECLKITTSAPAEKGRANRAVAAILAEALGVSPRDVALTSAPANPRKEFIVSGLSADEVRRRLAKL